MRLETEAMGNFTLSVLAQVLKLLSDFASGLKALPVVTKHSLQRSLAVCLTYTISFELLRQVRTLPQARNVSTCGNGQESSQGSCSSSRLSKSSDAVTGEATRTPDIFSKIGTIPCLEDLVHCMPGSFCLVSGPTPAIFLGDDL